VVIPRRPLLSDLGWKPCRWCQEPAPGGAATCTCTRAAYERHRSRARRNVKDLFWIEFGSMAERLGFGLSDAVARLMQVADDKENTTPPKFTRRAKGWVAERVSDSGIDDEDLRKWILDDFPEENAPEEGMLSE